jgi:hypothetical protein
MNTKLTNELPVHKALAQAAPQIIQQSFKYKIFSEARFCFFLQKIEILFPLVMSSILVNQTV